VSSQSGDIVSLALALLACLCTPACAGTAGQNPSRREWCRHDAGQLPDNGEVLQRVQSGPHEITISNGFGRDALVKLKDVSWSTALAFYVRAGHSARVEGVPSGTFSIVFETGANFSRGCMEFLSHVDAMSFDGTSSFKETQDADEVRHQILDVELDPVLGGNATIHQISPHQFL
jgi:hypothetical protein